MQLKMEKLYTVRETRPGADCGSECELLLAKFRLKLKKVGETTRPFRCVCVCVCVCFSGSVMFNCLGPHEL